MANSSPSFVTSIAPKSAVSLMKMVWPVRRMISAISSAMAWRRWRTISSRTPSSFIGSDRVDAVFEEDLAVQAGGRLRTARVDVPLRLDLAAEGRVRAESEVEAAVE